MPAGLKVARCGAAERRERTNGVRRRFRAAAFSAAAILAAPISSALISSTCSFAAGGANGSSSPSGIAAQSPAVAQAVALTAAAQEAATLDERRRRLDQARRFLEAFLRSQPTHPDAPRAEMQLGIVHTTQGQGLWGAAQGVEDAEARRTMTSAARDEFRKGEGAFSAAIDQFRTQIEAFPKFIEAGDPAIHRREALKAQLLQGLMYHAGVVEELAGTYPPDSSEYRDSFQAAADRYEQIYKDYRTLLAGLMARLKQGQCYHRIGNTRRALGLYNDVLTQPSDLEALRRLRVTAMYLSLEGWTGDQEKMYELAFSQGEEYLTHLRPEEVAWPEWQAVRFYTAQGYRSAAAGLKPDRRAERDLWRGKAQSHLETLAAEPGPYRETARRLASDWKAADEKADENPARE